MTPGAPDHLHAAMLSALLATVSVWALGACAGAPPAKTPTESRTAISPDVRVLERGERLYRSSCSACHGMHARGDGPVAPILKVPVPDLTLIAARRDGSFPDEEIYRVIDGQADLGAHGPRNMPIWGYEFFSEDPDDESAHREASQKVESLVEYLRSIQRPR